MTTWEIIRDAIKLLQLYIFTNFILTPYILVLRLSIEWLLLFYQIKKNSNGYLGRKSIKSTDKKWKVKKYQKNSTIAANIEVETVPESLYTTRKEKYA